MCFLESEKNIPATAKIFFFFSPLSFSQSGIFFLNQEGTTAIVKPIGCIF